MDNQHRKISGYRELTQAEIDLMNKIKALGPVIEEVCNEIALHINNQHLSTDIGSVQADRLEVADPGKWLRLGRDGMQSNLMMLTRAVAQPTFF